MKSPQSAARYVSLLTARDASAGRRNAFLLIELRWLAVFGQAFTIAFCSLEFGVELPLPWMFLVIGLLVVLNLVSMLRPRGEGEIGDGSLFASLLVDFLALTTLLFLSGGASNPFIFLYALQVMLGAILLRPFSTWVLVGLTCIAFALMTRYHLPLTIPGAQPGRMLALHVAGTFVCFMLVVVLLVLFFGRISSNLRKRDERLAEMRQQASEEDHIVRMGLLASGAAHELGTPLATLAVLVGDWRHLPEFRDHPERSQELADMDAELRRMKGIVGGILLSAGEARGESTDLTTLARFLEDLVAAWRLLAPNTPLEYTIEEPLDAATFQRLPIVSESSLRQIIFNVLDNASDVSSGWVGLSARCWEGELQLTVSDRGPGFPPEMLEHFGKPYQSTKGRPGGGLGLFLVVNVLRKLGGSVRAANSSLGGATVTLIIPVSALAIDGEDIAA